MSQNTAIFNCGKYKHNTQKYQIKEFILTGGPAAPRAPLGPVEPTGPCIAQIILIKNLRVNISKETITITWVKRYKPKRA